MKVGRPLTSSIRSAPSQWFPRGYTAPACTVISYFLTRKAHHTFYEDWLIFKTIQCSIKSLIRSFQCCIHQITSQNLSSLPDSERTIMARFHQQIIHHVVCIVAFPGEGRWFNFSHRPSTFRKDYHQVACALFPEMMFCDLICEWSKNKREKVDDKFKFRLFSLSRLHIRAYEGYICQKSGWTDHPGAGGRI